MSVTPMLMIPGPTPVPQAVLEAMALPPIGHRSPEFKAALQDIHARLPKLFNTTRPVFVYTSSGTGAMEAALINVLNVGDEILVLSCGVFSHRWADIATKLGLTVHEQTVPMGQSHDLADLKAFLTGPQAKSIKAVCCIHNETSTGVMNPLPEIAALVRAHSDALLIVDTVTSLGATPVLMDEWGLDVVVSGSQKGFMLQAGLSFLAASDRAMKAHQACKTPGYYFNFSQYEKNVSAHQTPYTPAISLFLGLQAALHLMEAEGFETMYARHRLNQTMTRSGVNAMGLTCFVQDDTIASPSVTAIFPPEGVNVDNIRSQLKTQFGITVANGQKELQGKIFRIGHLGYIFPRDILTTLSTLETSLVQLGANKSILGKGVQAAQEVLITHG